MRGKKYGGRVKGTPNAITSDMRALLREVVSQHLISDLNALSPQKRAELLIRCLPYLLPPAPPNELTPSDEPLVIVLTRPPSDESLTP
jgi:hypothetical protein